MRRWVCWAVSIILLFSAVAELLPLNAGPASALSRPAHAVVCSCRVCSGGASCCCKTARTALQAMVLKAHCDNPLPTLLAAKVLFPATLDVASLFFCLILVCLFFADLSTNIRSRAMIPLVGPPRSL